VLGIIHLLAPATDGGIPNNVDDNGEVETDLVDDGDEELGDETDGE
jgi:hypothetical protein